MRKVMKATAEGFYAGLGYIGFLALAGLGARDVGVLTSAAALSVALGIGFYIRDRRASRAR